MNIFFKELKNNTWKFWMLIIFSASWVMAIFDYMFNICDGIWFDITLVVSIVTGAYFLFSTFYKDQSTRINTQKAEARAEIFEPKREEEIRQLYREDPNFSTLCYQCIYFNLEKQLCSRKMSDDIQFQRVKEIRIGNRSFCLHWEKNPTVQ